jgi:cytoskeletal protein RodZ
MALSQDEQRMLAEIERRLAADDPGLASCLTTFRRPGPGAVLRSPRARIIGSLFTVLLVAMVSLMVYAMIPFRTHMPRHTPPPTAGAPAHTSLSAVTGSQPNHAQQSSAASSTTTSATATTSQGVTNRASTSAVTAKPQPTPAKPTTVQVLPGAHP